MIVLRSKIPRDPSRGDWTLITAGPKKGSGPNGPAKPASRYKHDGTAFPIGLVTSRKTCPIVNGKRRLFKSPSREKRTAIPSQAACLPYGAGV